MCEFCEKHGQGNRWYLNPENFSEKMMEDRQRVRTLEKVGGWGIDYYIDFTSKVTQLINWPVIGKVVKAIIGRMAPNEHGGQVVSLEDSLQLLEYARDFVLLPCACRKLVGHRDDMVCLNFGPIKDMQRRLIPEGPMEEITLEEAKELVRMSDERGHFHQVLYAKVPFPVCICNCDARYCTSLKQRRANNVEVAIFKGHEVCAVDRELCRFCEDPVCISRCAFGAMHYDAEAGSVHVHAGECFGCGLCRSACPRGALSLVSRDRVPSAAGRW
ncbi:MAG: 4Fe-4S binding protein [Actinobacteria bacterium]|nr:4Fe-4S binding protein [Actinomycetota bacterium]